MENPLNGLFLCLFLLSRIDKIANEERLMVIWFNKISHCSNIWCRCFSNQ